MRKEQIAIPLIREILARPRLADVLLSRMRWGNTFSEEFVLDPFAQVPAMLDDGYVTYHRGYQQWFVMGYDEAQEALHSPDFEVAGTWGMLSEIRPYSKLGDESKGAISKWLVFVDPPEHARLRRLVSRWFTPKRIEGWRPRVESITADLIADIGQPEEFDLMSSFAVPMPINVIGDILGLPKETWPELKAISAKLVKLLDPFRTFDVDVIDRAFADLANVILEVAAKRRAQPTDDLISSLVEVADDGDRLSQDELVSMVGFLMAAGHETTTGAIGNSMFNLAAFPAEREKLRNNPELVNNAVEELLRFDTPVRAMGRTAIRDVDIGGRTIKKGQQVAVQIAVANRDARRYPDANELRVDRPDPKPISFGHGIHHCLGAALARLELQVAIPALVNTLGDYTIDPLAVDWRRIITLRTATRMPVRPG